MIVIAHLIMFALLFAAGLPWLGSTVGADVAFGGDLLAAALMTLAAEAVVVVGAAVARGIIIKLGINPLLQRNKSTAIAHAVILVMLSGFLYASSAAFPEVISVSLIWAVMLSAAVVAILEVMVRVKRYLIARS